MTPAVSGPRTARQDRTAASGGKIGRVHARPLEDAGPRPLASVEPTSTAAADAQVRMALTDGGSPAQVSGPDQPTGGPTPNRPRGITTG
jgi:hypothetical protein